MYIDQSVSKQHGKIYTRTLLRTSYRENGKVKHQTIANLSKCHQEEIEAIKLALKHKKDLTKLCSIKEDLKLELSVGVIWLLNTLSLYYSTALGHTRLRELDIRLLRADNVSLPRLLPYRNVVVATRKKLTTRRPL